MDHRNILGLTVRYPERGLVKTRLAKDIGDDEACRVYRAMAEKIIAETAPVDGSYGRIIFYTPSLYERYVGEWIPGERIIPQRGKDIGVIMDNAFCDMFEAGAEKSIVVGGDIPGLNRNIIVRAFQLLGQADVVIGPATDGGYYLIGLKSRAAELFQGIPWGTAEVFPETLRVAGDLGLTVGTMLAMADVDTADDLARMKAVYPAYFGGA